MKSRLVKANKDAQIGLWFEPRFNKINLPFFVALVPRILVLNNEGD